MLELVIITSIIEVELYAKNTFLFLNGHVDMIVEFVTFEETLKDKV